MVSGVVSWLLVMMGLLRKLRKVLVLGYKMAVNEDPALYGQSLDIKENCLEWQIFDENDL
jgi:hypothetical protein